MNLRLPPKHRMQRKAAQKRLNIKALQNPTRCVALKRCLAENLSSLSHATNNTNEYWQGLKSAIHRACAESIGYAIRQHQDWFDENDFEIQTLLNQKRMAYCAWQNHPSSQSKLAIYRLLKAKAQRRIRHIKNRWWREKAQEMQCLADQHDMRGFFQQQTPSMDQAREVKLL